jgi:hypothetical protein
VHNYITIDDCATGINYHKYNQNLKAVVKENQYLDFGFYYELSIFWKFYEALATGGYYMKKKDLAVQPFLGSSISNWDLHEIESNDIYC